MADWVKELIEALGAEFAGRPMVCALATVDGAWPRVRHMVCRRVTAEGDLWISIDARSPKMRQIRENARAEVAFWLPGRREQYRISGQVDRHLAGEAEIWKELPEATRGTFFWPAAGEKLDAAAGGSAAIPPVAPVDAPETFAVIVLRAEEVDCLELTPSPHRRRRWRRVDGWVEERINP